MDLPFKYTTRFYQDISLANLAGEEFKSSASLDSLKTMAPDGIDFEKNIDLVGVAFNAAVANKFNKNGDGIDTSTALAIKDYFIHKPTNIEHQKQKVVGHIVGASLSSYGDNKMLTPEEVAESNEPFNIALSAVVYKTVNPDFADLVEESMNEDSDHYHKVSASWEIGFNDYAIALGSDDLGESEIISDERKEDYKQFLKAYGGNGRTDEGLTVNRLIMGDIYPIGIGFTANPAADVKGVVSLNNEKEEETEAEILAEYDLLKIKNNFFKNKNSHLPKDDVIFNKNQTPIQIMEKEILKQVNETLEAQDSSKKLSEEAIANITKVFHDAIMQKNDQWQEDKENLLKEKEELLKASEQSEKELDSLKEELATVNQKVSELEYEAIAREEAEKFTTSADNLFSASSNESLVRVEFSKKILAIVMSLREGTFLMGRLITSLKLSAVWKIK